MQDGVLERIDKIVAGIVESQGTTMKEEQSEPSQSRESSMRALSLWKASQTPDRHKLFDRDHNTSAEWSDQCDKVLAAIGTGSMIVILGNRGAGKTQMAVCAIRESCKMLRPALYVKAWDFFLDIRATYKKDSTVTERDVLGLYVKQSLLVVDAIENRSESQFENNMLSHMVDLRYDDMVDTILIANYDEKAFAAAMGPSIVDRIIECGIKVLCNWKSFRRNMLQN